LHFKKLFFLLTDKIFRDTIPTDTNKNKGEPMDFKTKINTLLASRGMTQADLANVLGYQTRQVNRAINGGHVSRRLKRQLADWADVEITFNRGGNGDAN